MTRSNTWKCELCGYIHSGENPPESCPVCGAEQEQFSPLVLHAERKSAVSASSWQCSICDYIHQGEHPPQACPVCGAAANLFNPHREEVSLVEHAEVKRIVVIGAGIAGLTAAEQARLHAPNAEITLVSREAALPYYRLNLTRFLAGEVAEEGLFIQQRQWFTEKDLALVACEAVDIDREARRVRLRDGRTLAYDRLVLANGSHPFVPPIAGATRDGVRVLRTLQDATGILEMIKSRPRVVCVGGGLLGLEAAGALRRQGAQVTVLEGHGWLLPRQLPRTAGLLLAGHVESRGIRVRCEVQVKEFTGDEQVQGVRLEGGEEIPADLVVLSTGVRPNSHLARQCHLKVGGGVIVDDRMYTSDPAILAAGDVAEHRGTLYGIWPASYAQGVTAGINAAGGQAEFGGLPMSNRLKVLDVDLFSIGQVHAGDASSRLVEVQEEKTYRALMCRDGRVAGAVLFGDTSLAGLLKDAVETASPLVALEELQAHFPHLAGLGK